MNRDPSSPAPKYLLVMRHAKSDPAGPEMADKDRPLSPKGIWQARLMGAFARHQSYPVDLYVVSPAKRTMETYRCFKDTFQSSTGEAPVFTADPLYFEGIEAYFAELQKIPDEYSCPLLIAHNPDLEYFLEQACDLTQDIKPATLALLQLEPGLTWQDLNSGLGKFANLITLLRPSQIAEMWPQLGDSDS